MNAPPHDEGGPSAQGAAPSDRAETNRADPLSPLKVALTMSVHVPLPLAVCVAAEANQIEAELRDRECRCPGRAYVAHAWDLDNHKDGCRAGYAWLSVNEADAMLQRLPRRQLAALSLVLGGAA